MTTRDIIRRLTAALNAYDAHAIAADAGMSPEYVLYLRDFPRHATLEDLLVLKGIDVIHLDIDQVDRVQAAARRPARRSIGLSARVASAAEAAIR